MSQLVAAPQVRAALRGTAGLALGGLTAFAELAFVVLALPLLVFPATRAWVLGRAVALAELERRRLSTYLGFEPPAEHRGGRAVRYLAVRSVVGGLGAGIFLLMLYGAGSYAIMVWQVVTGRTLGGAESDVDMDWYDPVAMLLLGVLLLFLALQGLYGVATLDRLVAGRLLGPTDHELLQRRLSHVTSSRAGVVEAVNDERRRIERALHDGVQQRLVALGMVLGRARRNTEPERKDELLRQAHEQLQQAVHELREVAWRVFPVALDEGGLPSALESLAEQSSVPIELRCELAGRLEPATEAVAYFVVSESVTNTIKHAEAARIGVEVWMSGVVLHVRVTDDGRGGADPAGGGLSGLGRRVAAADGEFTVDSPVGGPTVITARLPCG